MPSMGISVGSELDTELYLAMMQACLLPGSNATDSSLRQSADSFNLQC